MQSGLLDGKEEIRKFLKGASDYKLKRYVAAGMPVLIDPAGKWLAHEANIEDFFIAYTRRKADAEKI